MSNRRPQRTIWLTLGLYTRSRSLPAAIKLTSTLWQKGGVFAMADLLDMIASWHSLRKEIEFGDYCKRWVLEGNAKTPTSDKLLRNLLALDEPPPRRIRRAA